MRASRAVVVTVVALLTGPFLGFPPGVLAPAVAASGNLPGGTGLAVTIAAPSDGAVLPPGAVTLTGTASVGQATPVADTALITVLDVSNSTHDVEAPGCGDAPDGATPLVLDCEIAAARALNSRAAGTGTVGDVGAVIFGSQAVAADVDPDPEADRPITGPSTDSSNAAGPDIEEVFSSAFSQSAGLGGVHEFTEKTVPGLTNFADAITRTTEVAAASSKPHKIVAFLSDGLASIGGKIDGPLSQVPDNVDIYTFAVGTLAGCDETGQDKQGSLRQIATATGGICTGISDLATLPDILPKVIAAHLEKLTVRVDNGPEAAITDVTPALPVAGPAEASYRATFDDLAPGGHTVCVTATGSDAGGTGSIPPECRRIVINTAPAVSPGGPYSGLQGTPVAIAGMVTDPEGNDLRTEWTAVPVSGVDPDATCSFADPAAPSTTVSCTSDGVYTLTLTASDGISPAVSAGTTLTLTNASPRVSAGGPYDGTEDSPVDLLGTVDDPDSPGLSTRWTVVPGPAVNPAATCSLTDAASLSAVATCTDPGVYAVTLTVLDGKNRPVTATTTLTLRKAREPVSSLSLTAAVAPTVGFVGGDRITVSYTVRNGGETVMPSVRLTTTRPAALPAPAAVTPTAVTPTAVTPTAASPTAAAPGTRAPTGCLADGSSCDLGDLPPGKSTTVRIAFPATASIDATVTATATTSGPDVDSSDNTADARIVVRQPVLTVDPGAGQLGVVVHAIGKDFPAGARIRLAWSIGISQLPGEVTVGRDGKVDAWVLVFHHDQPGPRDLVASPVRGPRFAPVSSNSFLVLRRTLQPPGPTH